MAELLILGLTELAPTIFGAAGALGTLGTGVVAAGIIIGGAIAVETLLSSKPKASNAVQQAVVNQAVAPRVRIYGRALVGGTRAFFDSRNGALYQIVMLASDQIDSVIEYWIGDQIVTVSSGDFRVETDPFPNSGGSWAYINTYYGYAEQGAAALMLSDWGDVWSDQHQLKGIAYLLGKFFAPPQKNFSSVWPQSYETQLRAVVQGHHVYDSRTGVTLYSELAGDCVLDFLTHQDGMRVPFALVDIASFAAFADLCGEGVTAANGDVAARYRLWGTYNETEAPADVLARMLATCDGELYQTAAGKIGIRGGRWVEPTVTITDDDIISWQIENGKDATDSFNSLKPIYTDPSQTWQETEGLAWEDADAQARDGLQPQDLQLVMVPSNAQARRLTKIAYYKGTPAWTGTITTKLTGLAAFDTPEGLIRITVTELNLSFTAKVTKFVFNPSTMTCEIIFLSLSSAAYDWDSGAEEGQTSPAPQNTSPELELPIPTGLSLFVANREISAGTYGAVLIAEVTPPTRADLALEAEYASHGSEAWTPMAIADDSFEATSAGIVVDGAEYDVRARFTTATGAAGNWCAIVDVIAVANPNAPASPTGVGVSLSGSTVTVAWTTPSDAGFRAVRVYRTAGTGSAFSTAHPVGADVYSGPSAAGSTTDIPGTGTWRYWTVSLNGSGVASAAVSAGTVTLA